MPQIPIQRQMISTDVPTAQVNVQAAGMEAKAVSQVAQQVFNTGLQIFDHLKTEEAEDAARMRSIDDKYRADTYLAQLRNNSPDGYVYEQDANGNMARKKDPITGEDLTISKHFSDWTNEQYIKGQDAMPSGLAQDLYRQKVGEHFTGQKALAFNNELELRSRNSKNVTLSNVEVLKNQQMRMGGNLDHYLASAASTSLEILNKANKGIISAAELLPLKQTVDNELAKAHFEAIFNQNQFQDARKTAGRVAHMTDLRYAITGDYEKIKNPVMRQQYIQETKNAGIRPGEKLDPDTMNAMLRQIDAEIQVAQKLDHAELRAQKDESKATLLVSANPKVQAQAFATLARTSAILNASAPTAHAQEINEGVNNMMLARMDSPSFARKTREEQIASLELIKKEVTQIASRFIPGGYKGIGAASDTESAKIADAKMTAIEHEKKSDPVAFEERMARTSNRDADLNASVPLMAAGPEKAVSRPDIIVARNQKLKALGHSEVLTNSQAASWAESINKIDNINQITNTMQNLSKVYGADFPTLVGQMTKHGLPHEYAFLGGISNPDVARIIVKGVTQRKESPDEWKTAMDKIKSNSDFRNFKAAFTNNFDNSKNAPSLEQALSTGVAVMLMQGKSLPSSLTGDIVSNATKRFQQVFGSPVEVNGVRSLIPAENRGVKLSDEQIGNFGANFEDMFSAVELSKIPNFMELQGPKAKRELLVANIAGNLSPYFEKRNGEWFVAPRFASTLDGDFTGEREFLYKASPIKGNPPEIIWIPLDKFFNKRESTFNKVMQGLKETPLGELFQ